MTLLEREDSLQALYGAWQQVHEGGRLALVYGEAGIGKTSLVNRFTGTQKTGVLWGACDALFAPRPLGPLHDIATQLQGELLRLLQEGVERQAIFGTFLQGLQEGPQIVVFEDIHWADEATLDLLKYLARRVHLTRALLLVTYRDDELGPLHPLRLLLGDLARSPAVDRVPLATLSEDAVRRLAEGHAADPRTLHRQTGGNPFFLTEVLATEGGGVPPTVRDAVLARAAHLSLSGRAVLDAAAVAGPRIEPWLLAELTRAEMQALDESLGAGMLVAHGDVLTFRHELARQALLEDIAPYHRLFLHQAVLEALTSSAKGHQDFTRLAHHAAGARNPEAILAYAPAAAQEARRAGSLRSAAKLWALAIEHGGALPLAQQASHYAAFAAASHDNPDRSQAIEAYRQAVRLAQEGNDLSMAGSSLCRLAVMLLMSGETGDAVRAAEQALEMLRPLGPSPSLAVAHKTRAFLHLIAGENEQAVGRAESCLQIAAQLESTPLHMEAYHALGLCLLPLDRARGRDYLEKSLALVLEENAYWAAGSVHSDLLMTCMDVYDLERAEELIASGLHITREHDLDLSWLVIRAWQSIVLVYRARWEEAGAIADEVLAAPQRMEVFRVPALVARARLRARRGEGQVWTLLDEALALSDEVNNVQRAAVVTIARAEAAWLAGDCARTLREAAATAAIALQNRQPAFAAELAYWRWRCGEPVETHDWMVRPFVLEIEGHWQAAADAWQQLGCPYEQARALAQGDTAAQKEALLIFEQLGAQPMAERTRQQLRQAGVQTIPRGPRTATRENPFGLTNRQLQVLALLTEQLTNAEIAARLHISPKTVDHHVSAILARLDVASREEAAARAQEHPGT